MSIYVDAKTITTAGTPEALTDRTIVCSAVTIRAKSDNTGVVYICDDSDNTKLFPASGLDARESITLPIQNPAAVTIDVSVSGDGVDWIAV